MRYLRLIIIALAAICVLALGVFALVNPQGEDPGDVIIIKGGSLEVQCGKNHGYDCLGTADMKTGKYKAKKTNSHVTNILIRNVANPKQIFFSSDFDPVNPPQIEITYTDKMPAKVK